ncbi:MAG: carboxypeptidase regulatory-like domain-containing protein [Pseudomonadota bacterium]
MMNKWSYLTGSAAAVLAAAAIAPPAIAQQTVSEIRGQVTDATGAPISDATVTVVDTRTNQSRTVTTNDNGLFSARSLSIGGPYTVEVAAANRQTQRKENVLVSISGATRIAFQLGEEVADSRTLETIVVAANRTNLQQLAIGPGTSFGLAELTTLPSIDRDLRDTIRLDPRVVIDGTNDDNISCLGGNNRTNTFTVDGVRTGDAFGLNASGFPSRNASPIPFDSIQEVSVEFAPFDVEYGSFTGCNINVVTTSGANEIHGSGFFVFSNDALFGDTLAGDDLGFQDFENRQWGAQLSGPIIKDRLFFSVAYEQFDDTDFVEDGPAELGFPDATDGTLAQFQAIEDVLINEFGFETGGIPTTVSETNTRVLARLDANITDRHRAAFTYTYLDELFVEPDFGNAGPEDIEFSFLNSFEGSGTELNSYSLRLFSDWTDNFSTEFRISRADVQDIQNPIGGGEAQDEVPIPRFIIPTLALDAAGNPQPALDEDGNLVLDDDGNQVFLFNDDQAFFGPGSFRSANDLFTQTDQIKFKADYVLGNHTLTAGYELDSLDVFNLFAVEATGEFVFDDVNALAARTANTITATTSATGDINDAAAEFRRNIHTIYLQDEWQVTSDLTLTAGLRYDFYDSDDTPNENQLFIDRYGFSNATSFNDLEALQPRFGFVYNSPLDLFGSTTVTGGVGIFSGGDPTVFFSNAFSNDGFATAFAGSFSSAAGCTDDDFIVQGTGGVITLPDCVVNLAQSNAAAGSGRLDAIDPNLDLPTLTRYSIGFNHITDFRGAAGGFFDDWNVNLNYIHSISNNSFDFIDLTLTQIGVAPDGRPIFNAVDPTLDGCDAVFLGPRAGFSGPAEQLAEGGACDAGGDDQDILLTNAVGGDGNSDTFSFQLAKRFNYEVPRLGDGAIDINFGYALTDVTNVNPVTSSTATSNFEEVATFSINNNTVGTSGLFNRHNVTLAARFEQDVIWDLTSAVTLFYNGRSGRPFSFTFSSPDGGNVNAFDFGDTDDEDRNLLFVPELGATNVVFVDAVNGDGVVLQTAEAAETAFNAFIAEEGLDGFRGSILPRNAFEDPFFNDLDIRFEQELPTFLTGFLPDARALFFADIENFLNLINDDRNVFSERDRGAIAEGVPVIEVGLDPNDPTVFQFSNFTPDSQLDFDNDIDTSVWSVQFGIRFEF